MTETSPCESRPDCTPVSMQILHQRYGIPEDTPISRAGVTCSCTPRDCLTPACGAAITAITNRDLDQIALANPQIGSYICDNWSASNIREQAAVVRRSGSPAVADWADSTLLSWVQTRCNRSR